MHKIKVFDTHAHYDDRAYGGEPRELIKRILNESVAGFMAVGCCLKSIPQSLKFAEEFENVYAAIGIQPHNVNDLPGDYLLRLRQWADNPKVKAIGEIGLDYHYDGYVREKQIETFREQLGLADELGLPVIIHSRDAAHDTMDVLRDFKVAKTGAVMHCYSGSVETARELIKLGIFISFTGVITFKNARKSAEVCREIGRAHV